MIKTKADVEARLIQLRTERDETLMRLGGYNAVIGEYETHLLPFFDSSKDNQDKDNKTEK